MPPQPNKVPEATQPGPVSGEFRAQLAQPKLAPGPRDRKAAAQEAVLDTVLNAKSIVLELIEDFRASDRFFKYKAGVLASWVLISLASVFIACPSARNRPANELNARVRVQKVPTLDRQITAIYIENRGETEWGDILLKLNRSYSAAVPGIPSGRSAVIQLDKFSGPDGKTPPADLRPQQLDMRCNRGAATFDLLVPPP